MTKPSEITEPGWYWAEERIDEDPDGNDYELSVMDVDNSIDGVLRFTVDGCPYDAAAADAWFRIIRRIEEPEIQGGWA